MREPFQSSPAQRVFCLFSVLALSLLAGCGKLRGFEAHKEPDKPHSVTISWIASKSPVAGYNVYRESQFRAPIKLTTSLASGTEYVDRTVEAGRTYSYFVTSVDSKGLESIPSAKVSVTVPTTANAPAK